MKRFVSILAALTLLCACLIIPVSAESGQSGDSPVNLTFRQDGSFKIIQVADLQEFMFSSEITRSFLYELAERERPDLFVLTGDNIHCSAADGFPRVVGRAMIKSGIDGYMNVFDQIYDDFGARVTMVFGNHDNEAMKTITKAEEFVMYAAHRSFVGRYVAEADEGTEDEQGQHYGTHNLPISSSAGTAPVFGLWMFDSGSYDPRGGYSCVQKPQIDWFKAANEATGKLPSLAFQHIAVPEVYDYLPQAGPNDPDAYRRDFVDDEGNEFSKYVYLTLPDGAKGQVRESAGSGKYNQGQCAALDEAGNVLALFWGHDHTNTYELRRENGVDMVSSPATGFGSYGDHDMRGARVITLTESDLTAYDTYVVTYCDFYGKNPLQQTRIKLFNDLNSWANLIDIITFRPFLWLLGLFAQIMR
ncbi:MAG: metallophosphoesterase [Oscillospiraceae bacterium]|nr:metallophosphoesterase [Oscillospiraceae bacterium]